jgi:CubicO group peptidase (beta-lactamase class C family)
VHIVTRFIALAGCLLALPVAANVVVMPPPPTFDPQAFEAEIREAMDFPISRGYSAVIIRNGQFVHQVSGGLAQDNGNASADIPFTMDVPTNIGSSVKVLSFVAMLRAFESGAEGKTVEQWLDTRILSYLPAAWRIYTNAQSSSAHFWLRRVTFRQLMQHRSGWGARPGPAVFDRFIAGVTPAQYGERQYQNINATIVTYLLPRIIDPAWAVATDKAAVDANIANNDAAWYGARYGARFETLMQSMFSKVQPTPIRPSCDPAVDYGNRNRSFALSYTTTFGGTGSWYSEKATNGGCHAQGGYYMSMRELAMFWATFQATESIVKNSTKALMYVDSHDATFRDQLGWARIVYSPFLKTNFKVNGNPSHNGLHMSYKSAMIKLPNGYMAMIATNRSDVSASALEDLLKNAFVQGMIANFD